MHFEIHTKCNSWKNLDFFVLFIGYPHTHLNIGTHYGFQTLSKWHLDGAALTRSRESLFVVNGNNK